MANTVKKLEMPDGTIYELADASVDGKLLNYVNLTDNQIIAGNKVFTGTTSTMTLHTYNPLYVNNGTDNSKNTSLYTDTDGIFKIVNSSSSVKRPTYNGTEIALLTDVSVAGKGIYYGTCTTSGETAAKIVNLVDATGFSLTTGAIVIVKFTNYNGASNPTLNVNNTGAKPIMRYGTTAVSTSWASTGWIAGAVQIFVYDGTNWVRDYWINTTYSNATATAAGLMSASDKTKLDKISLEQLVIENLLAQGSIKIYSDNGDMSSESPWFGQNDVDTTIFSKGIEWVDQDGDATLNSLYFPNVSGTLVASSNNSTKDIQVVTSLPSSPDANTLYFIK